MHKKMEENKIKTQDQKELSIRSSAAEYLTFVAAHGDDREVIEMRYEDENLWLTQKKMAALYDVSVATINAHLKKIYVDSELQEEATIRKFLIVQKEGSRNVSREIKHYNLQAVIAVGFKVDHEWGGHSVIKKSLITANDGQMAFLRRIAI